jgi:hypothetical protein
MRPAAVLYVPTSATTLDECPRETVAGILDLQRLVGGYVEEFPVPAAGDVVMYGDEHARDRGRPANGLASLVLDHYARCAGSLDARRVVGDVVFCGYDPAAGQTDVPEAFLAVLRAHLPRTPGAPN